MNAPLVSVIIPTFNRVDYLREAIDSVLAQTWSNLEIIVSDDGGHKDTRTLVNSYHDSRLRYRRNPTNLGQTLNNRAAFREARGTYIANLHDDDRWAPDFLSTLVPLLDAHPSASIAFCDHHIINSDGSLNQEKSEDTSRHFGRDALRPGLHHPFWDIGLLDNSVPTVMASVMRRSALDLDDIPPEVDPIYDRWLTYLLCRDGHAAYFHPERLTYYRVHEAQESAGSSIKKASAELFCSQRFVADSRLAPIHPQLRRMLCHHHIDLGIELLCEGRVAEGRRHFYKGLNKGARRALPLLAVSSLTSSRRATAFMRAFRKEKRSLVASLRTAMS